jgi:hypothetical protein
VRRGFSGGLACLGGLLLAGCVGQSAAVTPEQAVASVQTGRPLLNCREPCLAAWQAAQPQAAQFAAQRRWGDLAALVLRIGYEDDLTLYYLGNAAEGIGYPAAAASYYRQSARLSQTSAACLKLSRSCGGVVLPRAAALRLAAIERELRRKYGIASPVQRRNAPAPGEPTAAPEAAESATSEAGTPAPEPVSAPAPSRGGPPASPPPTHAPDYIEPPPLGR